MQIGTQPLDMSNGGPTFNNTKPVMTTDVDGDHKPDKIFQDSTGHLYACNGGIVNGTCSDGNGGYGSAVVNPRNPAYTVSTGDLQQAETANLSGNRIGDGGGLNGGTTPPGDGTTIFNSGAGGGQVKQVTTTNPDGTTQTTDQFSDGSSVSISGSGADAKVDGATAGTKSANETFDRGSVSGSDSDCRVSSGVGEEYGCKGTKAAIETAKITNMVGQTAGSIATAAAGNSAQQQAMASGTQSGALHAAASTERTSGEIQVGMGAVNAVMGIVQMQRMAHHNGLNSDFNDAGKATLSGDSGFTGAGHDNGSQGYIQSKSNMLTNQIIDSGDDMNKMSKTLVSVSPQFQKAVIADPATPGHYTCNYSVILAQSGNQAAVANKNQNECLSELAKRQADYDAKMLTMKGDVKKIARQAAGEQTAMAQQAMQGGMMSIITGASQAVAGGFAIASADQLDQAANNMAAAENAAGAVPGFQPLGPSNMQPGDPTAGGNGNSLNPSTTAPSGGAASTNNGPGDLGNLGTPLGAPQSNTPGSGPAPGAFQAGQPGGPPAGGGGGLGGIGGASTAPASADQGDPQAKMADGKGAGYDGGAGGGYAGGGGGGVGADKGPDLSGMLAQFLPQKKDEEKNGNGILDFGGRNPAAEGPISLLDRNANIFDRIHETYQDKSRRGHVGL